MPLLIDGYNLLHAMGLPSRGVGPGTLAKGRQAILGLLTHGLTPEETAGATVVFDAHDAPPDRPRRETHGPITFLFAVGYESADDLIEELIERASAPRQLTVVSSDHRIRRAARRRRARSVTSEAWHDRITQRRRQQRPQSPAGKPDPAQRPLGAAEVERWLEAFGGEDDLARLIEEEREKGEG